MVLQRGLGSPFAAPRRPLAAAAMAQLWLGCIPKELDEEEALHQLALHKIRPAKLVLRQCKHRADGDRHKQS